MANDISFTPPLPVPPAAVSSNVPVNTGDNSSSGQSASGAGNNVPPHSFSSLLNSGNNNTHVPAGKLSPQPSQNAKGSNDNNTPAPSAGNNNVSNANSATNNSNNSDSSAASSDSSASDAVASNNTGTGDNSDSNQTNLINEVMQLILASQPQTTDQQGVQGAASTDASVQGLSEQDQALLQQLQQLLQQLMQQVSALGQGSTTSASADAIATDGTDKTAQQNPGDSKDNPSIDQLMAGLLAILQQINQQPDAKAITGQLDNMSVSADGQTAANVLTQLDQALRAQLGAATDSTTAPAVADSTVTDATAAVTTQTSSVNPFDKIVAAMIQSAKAAGAKSNAPAPVATDTTQTNGSSGTTADKLQTLLSDIVQNFTSASDTNTKQGISDLLDKSSDNNSTAANNNTPPAGAGFANILHNNTLPVTNMVKFTASTQPQTPVSEQVLVQIKNANDGANQIKIQLNPESLGKVEVQMTTGTDGKTSITITSDNRQTMAMLQNEAKTLEQSLRDIGIKTGDNGLSFNLSQQQSGNNSGFVPHGGYTNVAQSKDSEDDLNFGTINASYQVTVSDGLDIRV